MKQALLLFLMATSAFSNICICEYPSINSKFGKGKKGEIGLYKMGCRLWLAGQKNCRKRKVKNINVALSKYLAKHHRASEKVKIGFVGHWSSSIQFKKYLEKEIVPLNKRFKAPISIDITACDAMDDPEYISDYLYGLKLSSNNYIKVKGAQTTSIGMWDKLSFRFRKADLTAQADSRESFPLYPLCSEYEGKKCTSHQAYEFGKCLSREGTERKLLCFHEEEPRIVGFNVKTKYRWVDVLKNKVNIENYIRAKEFVLKKMSEQLGNDVDYLQSIIKN